MPTTTVEQRLRTFLLWLAGSMCVGTTVELFLAKHYEDPVQFIPFVLCGVGLIAVVAALRRPQRARLLALRGVMSLLLLGRLFGIYEHLVNNFAFELDMRPSAVWSDVWFQALRGAAPLLLQETQPSITAVPRRPAARDRARLPGGFVTRSDPLATELLLTATP